QIALLRDDPKLKLSVQSGMNVSYLALNTQKAPLNNPKVRRALSMLVNRDRLLKSIYYGTAEPARSLLPPVSWAFDHRLAEHYYTPAEAQKLLAEAGVSDLKLKLWVPTSAQSYNPSPLKMAELIQADMAKAGVKVSIIPIDTQSFERGMLQSGDYDMVLTGWVSDSDDPDSFLRPQLGCNAIDSGSNYARWCEPRFDAFLHAALTTDKLASRLLFYRNALQIMEEETPVIPIAHSLRLQGHRADLNGLVLSPFGSTSFSEVYRQEPEQ
ncbi:MAG: ABC transporter substrate-binding protein, partial [Plesiomonas shigelloides]